MKTIEKIKKELSINQNDTLGDCKTISLIDIVDKDISFWKTANPDNKNFKNCFIVFKKTNIVLYISSNSFKNTLEIFKKDKVKYIDSRELIETNIDYYRTFIETKTELDKEFINLGRQIEDL